MQACPPIRRWCRTLAMALIGLSLLAQAPAPAGTPATGAAAPPAPAASRLQTIPAGATVAVVPVEGMIYGYTTDSIEDRVNAAIAGGATVVVIELDTPGGLVTAASDAARFLRNVPVTTIAWVHPSAYSGGAMIATACDHIVVAPNSAIGDSAPVALGQNLGVTERAKALSPVLAEYRDNALANGYDYAVLQAMCVLGVELYLIEDPATGRRAVVNQVDYAVMVDGMSLDEADRTLSPAVGTDEAVGAAALSLAQPADVGKWRPVTTLPSGANAPRGMVHDGNTLLTLNATEALDIGLAAAQVADPAALQALLGGATVQTLQPPMLSQFGWWLTQPWARGILVMLLIVGVWLEASSPGLGIPGIIAFVALVLLIVGPLSVGLSHAWHLVLFLMGLGLLVLEFVALPTAGVLGVVGAFMMLVGVVLAVVPTGGGMLPAPGTTDRVMASALAVVGALFASLVVIAVSIKYFERVPVLNRLALTDPVGTSDDPLDDGTLDPSVTAAAPTAVRSLRVGDRGVTTTPLYPTGRATFDGRAFDVTSLGRFIDKGTAVRVTDATGMTAVVEPVKTT